MGTDTSIQHCVLECIYNCWSKNCPFWIHLKLHCIDSKCRICRIGRIKFTLCMSCLFLPQLPFYKSASELEGLPKTYSLLSSSSSLDNVPQRPPDDIVPGDVQVGSLHDHTSSSRLLRFLCCAGVETSSNCWVNWLGWVVTTFTWGRLQLSCEESGFVLIFGVMGDGVLDVMVLIIYLCCLLCCGRQKSLVATRDFRVKW